MNVHRTDHTKTTTPHTSSYSPANRLDHSPQTDALGEGVIILSSSGDVLYVSPNATQLIRQLDSHPTGNRPERTLPAPLGTIGHEVFHELQVSLMHGTGLACEVKRALPSPNGTLFVRGLGVPNQPDETFLTALIISTSPIDSPLSREV